MSEWRGGYIAPESWEPPESECESCGAAVVVAAVSHGRTVTLEPEAGLCWLLRPLPDGEARAVASSLTRREHRCWEDEESAPVETPRPTAADAAPAPALPFLTSKETE